MPSKNERVDLEMQISKYRQILRSGWDAETTSRMEAAIVELEQKLHEIDAVNRTH